MAVAVKKALCADVSNASLESLRATASRVDHWILVEYRGLWDRDVLGGSLLSGRLKAHLRSQLDALPHARLLFVRKPERRRYGRRQLFFGSSRPGEERFYGLEFDDHEDLVNLDFVHALGGGATPGLPVEHPLYVVCTHGKRDRCCAKYGQPLYDALRRSTETDWVWQSTHVGGDRFAGNVVFLPHGLYFGRVGESDAPGLARALEAGRIPLELYRGRSHHTCAVQAADALVRDELGLEGVDEVGFESVHRNGGGRWTVVLRTGSERHEVEVAVERGEEAVYLTCGAVTPQHARRYVATGHRRLS